MEREDYNLIMEEYDRADEDRRGELREIIFTGFGSSSEELESLRGELNELRGAHAALSADYEGLRKRYIERFSSPGDLYQEEPPKAQTVEHQTFETLFKEER